MTENSRFWGGTSVGDATDAPYSDLEFAVWAVNLLTYDRRYEGVVHKATAPYSSELAVSNPAGTTIRVAPGIAFVNGRWYSNSANIDTDVNGMGTGYYNVVLRSDEGAQTIRATIHGPQAGTPPAVTQDASYWEISIGTFYFDDGTNTISSLTDTRDYIPTTLANTQHIADDAVDDTKAGNRVPQLYRRKGGHSDDWDVYGGTTYTPGAVRMQCGVFPLTIATPGTSDAVTISFPVAFSYPPIVFITLQRSFNSPLWHIHVIDGNTTTSQFDVYADRETNPGVDQTAYIAWLAIGPE